MYPDYRDRNLAHPPTKYPSSAPLPVTNYDIKPERGGCLTSWLVVSSGASAVAVLGFLWIMGVVSSHPQAARQMPPGDILLFGIVMLVNIGSLVGIWKWKRWGVYGIVATAIASPFMEWAMGIATTTDFISPFIQLGILSFLLKDKWDYFD
ncbi:MAG TPA: hypothetical protein VHO69_18090 [Phototrophicaceae bacterium]|nr:hypothetical protein [Phototrophicaceae bacterium]